MRTHNRKPWEQEVKNMQKYADSMLHNQNVNTKKI